MPEKMGVQIFLAHANEEKEQVRQLYQKLKQEGYSPWLDEEDLLPGQLWGEEIPKAIKSSDFFIACLSKQSITKTGYIQKEFRLALNSCAERPQGHIYLIPLKFSDCEIPNLQQEEYGIALRNYQWLDYYKSDGFTRLIRAIEHQRSKTQSPALKVPEILNLTTVAGKLSNSNIDISGFKIENISKVQRFFPPLHKGDLLTLLEKPRELPIELLDYYTNSLVTRIAEIEKGGKKVTINKGYSAKAIQVKKENSKQGLQREHNIIITFEPADYSHQIMFGERVNEEGLIEYRGNRVSIKEFCEKKYDLDFDTFDWPDVNKLSFYQRFANVIGLIVPINRETAQEEKALIISVRSEQVFVENSNKQNNVWQTSMSCAEGMLRPNDADGGKESIVPSPFNTISRALREELGLTEEDFSINQIEMLAIGYDTNRCQPIAVFFLELSHIDVREIYQRWKSLAIDNNENRDLVYIPITSEQYAEFLLGKVIYRDKPLALFSNHQKLGAAIIGEKLFGGTLNGLQLKARQSYAS